MGYEKKDIYVKYYVFICYVNSSRVGNAGYMAGLEKPGIIKRLVQEAGQASRKSKG